MNERIIKAWVWPEFVASMSTRVLIVGTLAVPTAGQVTERVSLDSLGTEGNSGSHAPSISADGRYVAFASYANNLVTADTNGVPDVFVRDRQTGTTERVSIDSFGMQANGLSYSSSISSDGRYVAFASSASNLVVGDSNGFTDIFLRDRQSGITERLSVNSVGAQANGTSNNPSISFDGRYVVYTSFAPNLVSGDTNGANDLFVRDRVSGTTECVSVDSLGTPGNGPSEGRSSISADGRYVAFSSSASNLVTGDTNVSTDVFVCDRLSGTTERVSVNSSGVQGTSLSRDASISADGRYVAFMSHATNLVSEDSSPWDDVFVRDRQSGITERASIHSSGVQGNSSSWDPSISADGRYVAFFSLSTNLVDGDTNLWHDNFVRDRLGGTTERVSIDSLGVQGNGNSQSPVISADGSYVAYASVARNLVSGDTNGFSDIFVRDRSDTTSPTLTWPPMVVVIDPKSGPPGEIVFFSVTATDAQDPNPSVVCVPPSGSFFPRGTTVVTCTATDSSGNQSVCMFPVVVITTLRQASL